MATNKYAILGFPIIYTVFIWGLYINTQYFLDNTPSLPLFKVNKTLHDVLPPHPKTMVEAWKYGQLDARMSMYEIAPDLYSTQIDATLKEASVLAGRPVSALELHTVGEVTEAMEKEEGVVQRVKGLFSFINLVWLVSICGIMLAIGPVIWIIAAPLVTLLVRVFTDVIIPILVALQPLYELLAYILCFMFVVHGLRYPADSGFYISLTGCIGLLPSFSYTTYLHSTGGGNKQAFAQLFNFLIVVWFAPVALLYESSLLGFLTVVAFYGMLGFSVVVTGLCYYIGFNSRDALQRVCLTSVVLLIVFSALKVAKVRPIYLIPFTPGVMTMGCITYLLAILIVSSAFYRSYGQYYLMQFIMVVSLAILLLVSNVFGIQAMNNVACTFGVMYTLEKICEVPGLFRGARIWFAVLGGSVGLYALSLFLHSHPGWIVTMFDSSWLV